jgi:regulator of nucleoside diphosphate kinase
MTETKVKEIVAKAIATADIEPGKYYHVCWWEGKLQCLHVHHTKEHHPAFYAASGYVFRDGLTAHQWKLVTDRATEFCGTRGIRLTAGSTRRKAEKTADPALEKLRITEFDSVRLRRLLASGKSPESPVGGSLDRLQRLLESAETVAAEKVPADVVTMNSKVQLKDEEANTEMTLSLVFPADALRDTDFEKMNVSVLTPIGLSILGRRVGDTVEGRIRVHDVLYQPEAAGDYHL